MNKHILVLLSLLTLPAFMQAANEAAITKQISSSSPAIIFFGNLHKKSESARYAALLIADILRYKFNIPVVDFQVITDGHKNYTELFISCFNNDRIFDFSDMSDDELKSENHPMDSYLKRNMIDPYNVTIVVQDTVPFANFRSSFRNYVVASAGPSK